MLMLPPEPADQNYLHGFSLAVMWSRICCTGERRRPYRACRMPIALNPKSKTLEKPRLAARPAGKRSLSFTSSPQVINKGSDQFVPLRLIFPPSVFTAASRAAGL